MDHIQRYVEILEQPVQVLRFRYKSEERSISSIPGVNSTLKKKTFPTIRIVGYNGRAMVFVSCVTKEPPYRPHPHDLVGKEACNQGICTVKVPAGNMIVTFSNLGIQFVKKNDIKDALEKRQKLRVDPFQTGFEHSQDPTNIDLNAVRLCFQVFLEGSQKGTFNVPLQPIVSDPIFHEKALSNLVICKLSHCSASVAGGLEMMLLCEKVDKKDIQVRFFEERDGKEIWEGFGEFQPTHVHKQVAIIFRTPKYHTQEVGIHPVQIYIQLQRPSDNARSEPRPFQMLPLIEQTPPPMNWNNFYMLPPMQQQNQPIISPMMSQPNMPALFRQLDVEPYQQGPNLATVTKKAENDTNIDTDLVLDEINFADLIDIEANLSELTISLSL